MFESLIGKKKFIVKKTLYLLFVLVGIGLTSINLYGLTQQLRPSYIFEDELRFPNDQASSYDVTLAYLQKKNNENDLSYAIRATKVVAKGLAHIHWLDYEPSHFNQLVPIWENYFLYFVGRGFDIPEFQRYHFTDYKRSLQRGIGVCGDASMVLSQVLSLNNIENKIISFPGHVVVKIIIGDDAFVLDADFGVVLPFLPSELKSNPKELEKQYMNEGYTLGDVVALNYAYQASFQSWNGVQHFVTNKYYFEKISYMLKWPFPLFLILWFGYLFVRTRGNNLAVNFIFRK